jgi:nucleoside-diphosphate-sugar epimerase
LSGSPPTGKRTIVITGASGLIGSHLVEYFSRRQWRVRALVRDPLKARYWGTNIEVVRTNLPDQISEHAFDDADVVIHAAYATVETRRDIAVGINETGTARVLEMSRAAGVWRFVFVSSFAAHDGANSYYGRSKLALEKRLDLSRDLVLRPGFVLSKRGGLFGRLRETVGHSFIVPLFDGGGQILQTVHVDDLCHAFERALLMDLTGTLSVGEVHGISMRDFLQEIAIRLHRKVVMLSAPSGPSLLALRALERLGLRLPVTSENLLGLLRMHRVETAPDLARLGITVRDARQSLSDLL